VAGTGPAAAVALAMLALAGVFVAMAVPRASLGYRTQALQRALRAASSSQTTVIADADMSGLAGGYLRPAVIATAQASLAAGLRRDGLPLAPGTWGGLSTDSAAFSGGRPPATGAPPELELMYRPGLGRHATLIAGSLPGAAQPAAGAIQIAVTEATAARFGLHVGSALRAAHRNLVISGIVRPRDATASFWAIQPATAAPLLTQLCNSCAPYWDGVAFVGGATVPELPGFLAPQPVHGIWSFPLSLGTVSADQAAGLLATLQAAAYLPAAASLGTRLTGAAGQGAEIAITLSSGLVTTLAPFVATDDAVQRALSLLFVSLAVIAAVVVLLGARLVAGHRHAEFAVMRARGASVRQVAAIALAGGAIAALPAAAAAGGAAILATPGPAPVLSWWLAALVTGAALAGPPLLAAWQHRARRRTAPGTGRARQRAAAARRWLTDAALACAAVGGLVALRQQGLPPPGGVDLFTSAAPVLVAIPVALLIMRGYPPVLRWLARLAARRRGVVLVVGLARGTAAQGAALPAFALVLAFAVTAFAATARGAVQRAEGTASWQATGADAVVTAPAVGPGITAAAQHRIAGVPGVRRTAPMSVTTGTSGQGLPIPVVIVGPQQYAAVVAGTPAAFPAGALTRPAGARAGVVPVLLSPAGRAMLGPRGQLYAAGRELRIRAAGSVASFPGVQPGGQFVVLPRWALGGHAPAATVLAIAGPRLDTAALSATARRAVPGAQVTLRSQVLAAISGAPLPHGGFVTYAQGAAAAAGFGLLVLALTLVLGARSRDLTLTRLATMGLAAAQRRRIMAAETLPAVLAAALGGVACALALVPLVGPALNLAAFTGMPVTAPLRADLTAVAATAGGLLFLAGLVLTITGSRARARGAAQALRTE
jgi:putative ABC transport system permease protein